MVQKKQIEMKLIGFNEKYDKMFVSSKYYFEQNAESMVTISQDEERRLFYYFENSKMITSKTLALFDGNIFINPYMIFTDGDWIWPSYFPYYIAKEKKINKDFFSSIIAKDFKPLKITEGQYFRAGCLVEEIMLTS